MSSIVQVQAIAPSLAGEANSSDNNRSDHHEHDNARIKRCKVDEKQNLDLEVDDADADADSDACTHPGSFEGMCIRCGHKLDAKFGLAFRYIHKGLRLHKQEIARLSKIYTNKNLLCHKKLYLVLDLDHTLLHSIPYLTQQDDQIVPVPEDNLFKSKDKHMITKLRPFVRTFLKEVSTMFEMYIYTLGDRSYALEMAKLLDPRNQYFNQRVISRDDCTQKYQKSLDIVLGNESAVVILDDSQFVWRKHRDNLILMKKYFFFAPPPFVPCKSLAELKVGGSEPDTALEKITQLLKQVHHAFFDELHVQGNLEDRDVRQVLRCKQSQVLKGCILTFSSVVCHKLMDLIWQAALYMGATCLTEVHPLVTHVVATHTGTVKSIWAIQKNKFLVHPQWIEASFYFWQKQPEEQFSIRKRQ